MSDFLHEMARLSAERAAAIAPIAAAQLDKPVVGMKPGAFDIIAEIKGRSPAEGELGGYDVDHADRARQYANAGAVAISVLTEPAKFDGSIAHLEAVVDAVPDTPVMRKDFLVDVPQVLEARAAGASGVLLIVAMLSDAKLREMLDCAYEHNMFVLLEMFDMADAARTSALMFSPDEQQAAAGKLLFGVNCRDLRTLEVDPGRFADFDPANQGGRWVAESGLYTAEDAATIASLGYSMALVGTSLMRRNDPGTLITDMRTAGAGGPAA